MSICNAIASVAVNHLEDAVVWYTRLLDRAPDNRPMGELAEWRFERGGWLQVYELAERAGGGSVTLATDDIDAQAERLLKQGIAWNKRGDAEAVRTLMLTDLDGNHIAFAQALQGGLAR